MEKALILKGVIKKKLEYLIRELMEKDYKIETNDWMYYILSVKHKIGDPEDYHTTYRMHWVELCISEIPRRLGIEYLTIPTNNDDFNLAEYLINYYEEYVNMVKEKLEGQEDIKEEPENFHCSDASRSLIPIELAPRRKKADYLSKLLQGGGFTVDAN